MRAGGCGESMLGNSTGSAALDRRREECGHRPRTCTLQASSKRRCNTNRRGQRRPLSGLSGSQCLHLSRPLTIKARAAYRESSPIRTTTMAALQDIQALCSTFDRRDITEQEFISSCARFIVALIGCSRAGIWLFETSSGGHILRCLGIFDRATQRMTMAPDESSTKAAPYFAALEQTGHVIAPAARTHPATAGFFANSLAVNGVESLLATSFSLNGQLFGTFTCTEVGHVQHWTPSQLLLLKRVATRASLSLAGASRVSLPTMPVPL